MQISVSLDRDKNSSVGVDLVLLLQQEESEKWLTVGLCFKFTNQACGRGENYGQTCFILFLFDDQLDLPVKETDSTGASKTSACDKEASLEKKKDFFFCFRWCNYHCLKEIPAEKISRICYQVQRGHHNTNLVDKLSVDIQNAGLRALRSGKWLRELRTLAKKWIKWLSMKE